MCAFFHFPYAVAFADEAQETVPGLRKALKPGGKLVIVDNWPTDEKQLAYRGSYRRTELIQARLADYGFTLAET